MAIFYVNFWKNLQYLLWHLFENVRKKVRKKSRFGRTPNRTVRPKNGRTVRPKGTFAWTLNWSSILRYLGNQTLSSSMVSELTCGFLILLKRMVLSSTSKVRCYWFFRKKGVKFQKSFQTRVGHFLCQWCQKFHFKGLQRFRFLNNPTLKTIGSLPSMWLMILCNVWQEQHLRCFFRN